MTVNGLDIKPQIPPLPVQLGTMISFARAGSASALSHAWSGVEQRVWGGVRELDQHDVAFPGAGAHASAYADFRDTVISRSRHYMDRRVGESLIKFEQHENFRQIGVEDPVRFAELLLEARAYGIISKGNADLMLVSAKKAFEGQGLDFSGSEMLVRAFDSLMRERFEAQTRSKDVALRPVPPHSYLGSAKACPLVGRRAIGALAGLGGAGSLALGAYMLSIAAPGIVFLMLGVAGVVYGISTFVSNPRRPG